jgi:HAMP domain-containing protein
VNQAQEKALRLYPGTPMINTAIKRLELAQDMLIDVGTLVGANWNQPMRDETSDVAARIGTLIINLKKKRGSARWSK